MNKVPSIVQILFAEMLAIWGTSSLVMAVWNTARPGAFGPAATLRGVGNWVWFAIGLALLVWLLREIFQARVKQDSWVNPKTWSSSGGAYGFCSTHPSYFFIDLIPVAVSVFLLWYARGLAVETKNYWIMLAISLIFPVLRLLSWYVLGLKIESAESGRAWHPVAFVFIPFVLVFGGVGIAVAVGGRQHADEIANLPVIDEHTFANSREAFARLADTTQIEKQTGFVRLRAKQISDGPTKCQNRDHIDFATVLADLAGGGDVLIVASKYAHDGFDELVSKATANGSRPIEVIGKLREMPRANSIPTSKAFCGLDKLPTAPPGGRWVLEMHEP
ncbi:MAG TPA: hypothetical protein VE961_03400 [Pyrinomonadaceae bacterium]|nr:hypothetical protein [Pyrinomonadaceae bacterium]